MKKTLCKTIALIVSAFAVSTAMQTYATVRAETPEYPSSTAETVTETENAGGYEPEIVGQTKLRVRSCDFTSVVGERAFYLPRFDATSADGTDISHLVTITDSKQSDIDEKRGVIILKEAGAHEITYSVTDPATEQTISRSFTLTQYREIFNYYNLTGQKEELVSNQEQYCISLNPGQGISRFNIPVSNVYYAEVYYNATEATQFRAGLAHVNCTNFDKGTNSNLWWASMVDIENEMAHRFYKDKDWKLEEISGSEITTTLNAGEGFKYAVARYKTTLYAFINDVLVATYDCAEIENLLTAPGIFTAATKEGDFVSGGGVKISDIEYFGGTRALQKIEVLTKAELDKDIEVNVGNESWGDYDAPIK